MRETCGFRCRSCVLSILNSAVGSGLGEVHTGVKYVRFRNRKTKNNGMTEPLSDRHRRRPTDPIQSGFHHGVRHFVRTLTAKFTIFSVFLYRRLLKEPSTQVQTEPYSISHMVNERGGERPKVCKGAKHFPVTVLNPGRRLSVHSGSRSFNAAGEPQIGDHISEYL